MRKRLLAWLLMAVLVLDNASVAYASSNENNISIPDEQIEESAESQEETTEKIPEENIEKDDEAVQNTSEESLSAEDIEEPNKEDISTVPESENSNENPETELAGQEPEEKAETETVQPEEKAETETVQPEEKTEAETMQPEEKNLEDLLTTEKKIPEATMEEKEDDKTEDEASRELPGNIQDNTIDLSLDQEETVHIEEAIGESLYRYVPEETGVYVIRSSGDSDPYVEIYENGMLLNSDDDSGENNNFYCEFIAEEGYTYSLKFTSNAPEIDFNVLLTKKVELEMDKEENVNFNENNFTKYYAFTVPEEGRYTISSSGGTDPYLDVFKGHESIGSDDDSGQNYGFKYSFQANAGEVYCFGISNRNIGELSVLISKDEIKELNLNEETVESLENSYDEKWYSYTATEEGRYTFAVSEAYPVYVEIYDGSELVNSYNSSDEFGQKYTFSGESGKTYYFVVRTYEDVKTQFSVGLTIKQEYILEEGKENTASVEKTGEDLWYTYTPDETGYYTVSSTGSYDTAAEIFCNGESIGSVDDSWGSTGDFSYRFWMEEGKTYSFRIYILGSETGKFSILLKKTQIHEIQKDKDSLAAINEAEPEVWYHYTAAESEKLQILLSGAKFPYVELYEENQYIAYGQALQFAVEAGKDYYFRIYNQNREYGDVTVVLSKAKEITDFKLAPGYTVPEKILYGESLDSVLGELKFEVYYGDEVYTIGYWDSTLYGQSISTYEAEDGYDDNGIYKVGLHNLELLIGEKNISVTIEVVTGDKYSFTELTAGSAYTESEKNYNGKAGFAFTPEAAGRYRLSFSSGDDVCTIYRSDGTLMECSNGIIEIPDIGATYYILASGSEERIRAKIESIPEVTDIKIASGYEIPNRILYGHWLGNVLDDVRFDVYYGEEVQNVSTWETTTYGDQISYDESDVVYDEHGNYELGVQNFKIEVGRYVFPLSIEVVTGQELGFPVIDEELEFIQSDKNYGSKVGFQFTPEKDGRYRVTFFSSINECELYDASGNQLESMYGDDIVSSLKKGETYYFIISSDSNTVRIGASYIPDVTAFNFAEDSKLPERLLFGESEFLALENARFDVSYGTETERLAFGANTSYGDNIYKDENYWDAYDENGIYKLGLHQFNIVAGNMKIPISLEVTTGDQLGFVELRENAGYIESGKNYGDRIGYAFTAAKSGKYQFLSESAEYMGLYTEDGKTVNTIYGSSLTEQLEAGITYYLVVDTGTEEAKVRVDIQPEATDLKVSSDSKIPEKVLYGMDFRDAFRDVKFDIQFDNGEVLSAYLYDWTSFGSVIELEDISEEVYDENGEYRLGEHTIRFVIDRVEIQTTVEVLKAEELGFENLQTDTKYVELTPNYGNQIGFRFSPEESRDYRIIYELPEGETYVSTTIYASDGEECGSYWGTDISCSLEEGIEYCFILSTDSTSVRVKIEKIPEITDFRIYDSSCALEKILYGESYWRALEQIKFQIAYDGQAEIFGYHDLTSKGQRITVQESGNSHDQNGNYRRGFHDLKLVIGDKEISYSLEVVNGSDLGFTEIFEGDDYKEAECNYGKYVGYEFTALESKEYKISASDMNDINVYDMGGMSLVNSWSTEGIGGGYTYCNLEQGETYYIIVAPGTADHTGVRISDAFEYMPAPSNLRISNSTYSSISLWWDYSESAEGYEIWRSESENGEYVNIENVLGGITYYTDKDVTDHKTYYYKIRAFGFSGLKKVYSSFSWTVSGETLILSAPANVKAEPKSYNSVQVTWDEINGADNYQVYRSVDKDGNYVLLGTYEKNVTSMISQQLSCGTTYYYKVRAYALENGKKYYSDYSQIDSATPILSAPQGVTAKGRSYNTVDIGWNKVEGAQYYQVYRSTSTNGKYALLGTYDEKTTSSVSRKLACGTKYYYKVRAYRWSGGERVFSGFSNIANATPMLSAPQGVSARGSSYNTVDIGWNKVEGAQYYQVYRSTSTNGKYALLGTYDEKATSSVSRKLACGTKYYYKVRAYRWSGGERVFSSFSTIVNATPRLSTPSNVKAAPQTSSTIRISWNKVEGASYYQVYRAASKNGKYSLLGTYDSNTSSSISKSLKKNTTYYYKVRGYRWVNGKRVFSSFSAITSAKTLN